MCGIAGLFWSDPARPADAALLGRLSDTLVHRGPDGGGAFTRRPAGHRPCGA